MYKYLYLTEVEWSVAWINGGEIPISLASTYLNEERDGILTPDENLIHRSEVDIRSLSPAIHFENIKNLNMSGCSINGKAIPKINNASLYKEDGLILSFCNSHDDEIATRLGKSCCVRISNIKELYLSINKQLGVKGKMGDCKYTQGHNRNHFLKSVEDEWQQEFRMFWAYPKNAMVTIPSGLGKLLSIYN